MSRIFPFLRLTLMVYFLLSGTAASANSMCQYYLHFHLNLIEALKPPSPDFDWIHTLSPEEQDRAQKLLGAHPPLTDTAPLLKERTLSGRWGVVIYLGAELVFDSTKVEKRWFSPSETFVVRESFSTHKRQNACPLLQVWAVEQEHFREPEGQLIISSARLNTEWLQMFQQTGSVSMDGFAFGTQMDDFSLVDFGLKTWINVKDGLNGYLLVNREGSYDLPIERRLEPLIQHASSILDSLASQE